MRSKILNSFNCIMEGTWNELCDEAIQYLQELKMI